MVEILLRIASRGTLCCLALIVAMALPGAAHAQDPCPQECDPHEKVHGCCPIEGDKGCPQGKLSHKGECVDTCPDGFEPRNGRCRRKGGGTSAKTCDAPKELTDDGHCCWPGQVWIDGCSGKPERCPDGFENTGTSCEPLACAPGMERTSDGIHCCWPGQKWSNEECRGTPRCPRGFAKDPNEDWCTSDDVDRDGLVTAEDACPDEAEDIDGIEDQDGCPEDNDRDGFADAADACPSEAEDLDGYDDRDGCPELDNDRDGLADLADRCPDDAEDLDGIDDGDGCPDLDDDGDGVTLAFDRCPGSREDHDGWADGDGCPEDDADQDGVADVEDRCADTLEDPDGFEDGDGCLDADNDRDGFADTSDPCADAAEDLDGLLDDDGCPEDDADQDGVADVEDRCALHGEDDDGFEDGDGCREEHDAWFIGGAIVLGLGGTLGVTSGILFAVAESARSELDEPEVDAFGRVTNLSYGEAQEQLDTSNDLIIAGWSTGALGATALILGLAWMLGDGELPDLDVAVTGEGASLGITTRF